MSTDISEKGLESLIVRHMTGTDGLAVLPNTASEPPAPYGGNGYFAGSEDAEVFEQAGALDRLEAFASFHGPDWYGLPRNTGTVTLVKERWTVPADYPYISGDTIVPLRAGETLSWKMR